MAKPDWTEKKRAAEGPTEPGAYLVEIKTAKETRAKTSGNLMFAVSAVAVDWGGKHLFFDNFMLEGGGSGIGTAKLVALGIPKGQEEVRADELIGRRAYVYVSNDEFPKDSGTFNLKPDISEGSHCGFWLESERDDVPDLMRPDADAADDAAQGAFDDAPFGADDTSF